MCIPLSPSSCSPAIILRLYVYYQVQLLSVLSINFLTFTTDWEARFRVLVALGTLLASGPEAVDYARTLEVRDGVRSWRLLEGAAKVTECAQYIENIL